MGDHTYPKTKLGCSIPHNKHISTKILSILLAILLVTTVFSSITFASDSNDDSTEENNIIASILGDVKDKISSAGSKLGSRLRDLIDRIRENRKGLLSLSLVTKYQKDESSDPIESSTRMRLILPTSIDVDGDGDRDIRVWIIRRPAIDLHPPALCWKTSLIVRRLPGMKDIKDDFLEVYLEYKPRLFSILKADADRIRIGYQSPMGEEIPKTCIVTHKNVPHFLYPLKKTSHRIGINPISIIGKDQLNLLFSVVDMVDGEVSSELMVQVNHSPAVKSEISFDRSKDRFIRRGQTLEFSRKTFGGPSNITLTVRDRAKEESSAGSLTISNVPKKISVSWFIGRKGYLEIDSHGSCPGAVRADVDGVITLGFKPESGLDFYIGWDGPGLIGLRKGKGFNIEAETSASAVLSDFYVKVPSFTALTSLGLSAYKFDLTASLLSLKLKSGTRVGNLVIKPTPGVDYVRTKVENAELVLEDCVIDIEPIELPEEPEKPTVSITSPKEGDTVDGNVIITGTAKAPEDKEIQYVEIRIDDRGEWFKTEGTETWSYEWDSKTVSNGLHTISAGSFDGEYYSTVSKVSVTVNNDGVNWYPTVTITSPIQYQLVSGVVTIAGIADDDNDPKSNLSVSLQIKDLLGKNVLGEKVEVPVDVTGHWSYEWNTTDLTAGLYTIDAKSYDGKDYSLTPVKVEVWVRLKCSLDFNILSASIDVTNFAVHGESASLDVSSFSASGSGALKLSDGGVSIEVEGSLDIVNTTISVTNESSGITTKILDNLSVDFDGYGMFLLSNPEIELDLDASLYVHADGIFESAAVTFALDGNASVCIEFDKDNGVLSMGGGLSAEGFVLLDITNLSFDITLFSGFYLRLGADQIKMKGTGSISVEDNSLTADGYLEEFILDNFYVYTDIGVIYLGGEFEFSNTASITLDLVDPYTFNLSSDKGILVRNPYMGIRASGYDLGAKAGSIEIEQGGYVYLSYFEDEINISCHVKTCNVSIIDLAVWFNGSTYDIGNISGSFEFWFYLYLDDLFIDSGLDWIKIIIRGNGKTHVEVHRTFNVSGIKGSIDAIVDFETGDDGTFMIYLYNLSGSIGININGSAVVELTDLHLIYGDIIDLYVPKATGNLELVSISKESGLFMFTMEGGGSSLYLDFSIELGDSDLGLYIVVDDAHIDLDGTSASLKLMWNDSGITNFGFALDADVTLTIDDVDVKLVIEGNDTLNLENLTVYLVGYIGAYVDLVMPFDFVNDTFDINLGDLDVYLGIDDLSVAGMSLGRIEISANVTGNATISLLDIKLETQIDHEFEQFFNITYNWINLTIGINATDGVFKLNSFEIESIPFIGGINIVNLSIVGYTTIDFCIGPAQISYDEEGETQTFTLPLFYIRIALNNDADTAVSFESFSLAIPFGDMVVPIRLYDADLVEGAFDVFIRMVNMLAIEVRAGSAIDTLGLEIADPDHELGYLRIYFDEPFDYFHLDWKDGYFTSQYPEEPYIPGSQYLLLDTHNETVTLDVIAVMKMDFLNTSNDDGVRLSNITLSADEFYVYLPAGGLFGLIGEILEGDFSNVSIAGYLKVHSPDGIGLLINGTWYELPFGGEGFDFIITPGHIHIGGSREIYIDEIIEIDGQNLTISGTFFFQTEHDSVDIYYNLTEGMIKIVSNASVGVTDFYFNYGNLTVEAEEFVFEGNSTFTIEGGTITFNGDKAAHLNLTEIHFENQNWNITVSGLFDFFNNGNLTISKNSAGQVEFNIGESLIEVSDFLFIVNNLSILMELFYISAERDVNLTFEPGNWTVNSSVDTNIVLTNLSINGTDPLLGMDWNLTLSGVIHCSRTGVVTVKTDLNLSALPEFEVSYVEIGFRDGIFDISDLEFSISDLSLSCDSFQVSAARNVNFTFENGNLTINSSAEASFALTDFYVEGVGPLFGMEWNLTITGSFDFPRNATIHIRTGGSIEIELSSGSVEITNFDFNVNDISASWSLFSIEGSGLLVIENGNIMVDANLTSLTLSNCQFNLPLVNLTIEGNFNLSAAGRFYIISDLASYARFISEGGILEISDFYLGINDLNLSWDSFQVSASRDINLSIENGNLTINSSAAASVTFTELYVEGIGPLLGMEWDLTVNGGFNLSHGGVLRISTDLANYFAVNLTDGSLVISDFSVVSDNLTLDIPLLSLSADADVNFSANLNGVGSSKGGDNGDGGGGPGFNDGGESDPPDPSHEEDDVYIKLAGTFLVSGSLDVVLASDENFVEVFIDGAGYLDMDLVDIIVETASFYLSLVTDLYIGVDLDATFRLEDSNLTISGSGDVDININDLDANFKYEGTGFGIIPGDNTWYIDVTFSIPSIDFLLTGGAEEITIELGGAEVLEWISVSPTNSSIYIDDKLQLTATTNPPGYEVNWVSSNESIASVNDTGVVTAHALGTVEIYATAEEITSNSATINVISSQPPDFYITPVTVTLGVGKTVQLTPHKQADPVDWWSSNDAIASVDDTGLVTVNAPGSATITAEDDLGKTANSTIITPIGVTTKREIQFEGDISLSGEGSASVYINEGSFNASIDMVDGNLLVHDFYLSFNETETVEYNGTSESTTKQIIILSWSTFSYSGSEGYFFISLPIGSDLKVSASVEDLTLNNLFLYTELLPGGVSVECNNINAIDIYFLVELMKWGSGPPAGGGSQSNYTKLVLDCFSQNSILEIQEIDGSIFPNISGIDIDAEGTGDLDFRRWRIDSGSPDDKKHIYTRIGSKNGFDGKWSITGPFDVLARESRFTITPGHLTIQRNFDSDGYIYIDTGGEYFGIDGEIVWYLFGIGLRFRFFDFGFEADDFYIMWDFLPPDISTSGTILPQLGQVEVEICVDDTWYDALLPPEASYTYTTEDKTLYVDATESFDLDGDIERYYWKWDSYYPWTEGEAIDSWTYAVHAWRTVSLKVIDNHGKEDIITKTIYV